MRGFDGIWLDVLGRAIDTARVALRDLDDAELPAGLRRVAAYQGGRLPPPLGLRLLKELDENDWLREKVAESWDGPDDEPSGLFLLRPVGWWWELAAAAGKGSTAHADKRIAELEAAVESSEQKRLAAINRAKESKRASAAAERAAKEMVEKAKKKSRAGLEVELAAAASARSETAEVLDRLDTLEAEHLSLQDAFAALRARFAKGRRARLEGGDAGGGSSWLPSDPVKLARFLDLQTAEFGRDSSRPRLEEESDVAPLVLAPGIRPDGPDAIRWLVDLEDPVAVLVDGYNAQFHINSDDFTSGSARRYLVDALKRLRMAATVKHRVVVVFDSTMPGERTARTSLSGVEVRFADDDRIADEEIVEMAASLDRVVVISSDRAVREGAEESGAVVLWSEALSQWLERY